MLLPILVLTFVVVAHASGFLSSRWQPTEPVSPFVVLPLVLLVWSFANALERLLDEPREPWHTPWWRRWRRRR